MEEYIRLNNELLNTYDSTGEIDREKDKFATKRYFLDNINVRMRYFITLHEKINYLVEEGYYEEDFLKLYDFEFIKQVFAKAYSYKFRFPSFMSASKFYDSYALKSRDGKEILEKYEDRVAIIALYLASGDEELAMRSVEAIMEAYQPATPTALNSGKKARGELVSCFQLTVDDTMNSIAENIGYCLELSRLGGGVGVNLTDVRPLGDPIKGILNRASGIMPVAKLLENAFSYSNQLGARDGSGVIYTNIFHGDIESFISSKKPNADEKIRLATLSTGVIIPRIFFRLMEQNKDVVLFSPYDIYKEYGKRMSEISMTEMYYELLDNPNIRKLKRINARQLYTEIKKSQFESGYPFEVNDDNMNELHALKNLGRIKMSNLCTEIAQLMVTSIINDKDKPNNYGLDVSCNLGSVDIHAATKVNSFEKFIDVAMRMLTSVSIKTSVINVPSVKKANEAMHSVGLGIMNLHGHLIASGIEYGSNESIQFVDRFMEALNYYSLWTSMKISHETGQTFEGFEKSDYASGEYFEKFIKAEKQELSAVVENALGNVPLITEEMWTELKGLVQKYGVYNAYRNCIAPTGSISYVRNSTPSLAPITQKVEIRDYGVSRTIYPAPFLTNDNMDDYKEAYDIDQFKMIDLYAAAQKHIDQAISMTLYITDDWNTEQLARLYIYAEMKGIKSVYYVRQRLTNVEDLVGGNKYIEKGIDECETCSI